MGKFLDGFKKSFKEELAKQVRPHFETALANIFADRDIELDNEALGPAVDDFIFYLKKSMEK